MRVEFHPDAEQDIANAQQWYAERSAIAARAFLTELMASVDTVAQSPARWPRHLAGTRRYVFAKFPFSLVYRVTDELLTVVAVTHHRRKPGYWSERH